MTSMIPGDGQRQSVRKRTASDTLRCFKDNETQIRPGKLESSAYACCTRPNDDNVTRLQRRTSLVRYGITAEA